jgi:hypothetical protein
MQRRAAMMMPKQVSQIFEGNARTAQTPYERVLHIVHPDVGQIGTRPRRQSGAVQHPSHRLAPVREGVGRMAAALRLHRRAPDAIEHDKTVVAILDLLRVDIQGTASRMDFSYAHSSRLPFQPELPARRVIKPD